ncbi:MAG: hypothetical protein M3Y72_09500 [Acidobacteriota bacterium]|nr:hypothetical protein [Acidobacteriota bacterium]
MGRITGLGLTLQPASDHLGSDRHSGTAGDGSYLRYAFLALLAANIFVLSGALCFAVLYFTRS